MQTITLLFYSESLREGMKHMKIDIQLYLFSFFTKSPIWYCFLGWVKVTPGVTLSNITPLNIF